MTTVQLEEAGLDSAAVWRRVRAQRLHPLHRGVYAVGHRALGDEGRWMAAVLAAGPGAGLTGVEGARLRGLLRGPARPIAVMSRRSHDAVPGVRLIRMRAVGPGDLTIWRGIPVASVSLILLHLAADGLADELRRALAQAQFMRVYDPRAVRSLLERSRGRRGAAVLRALTEEDGFTETEIEDRFARLVRSAGLPRPRLQFEIALGADDVARVDFAWPEHGLIVETDGREGHLTAAAFEEDRARDAALAALGWRVVRFTWRQVRARDRTVATLRRLLARGGPRNLR